MTAPPALRLHVDGASRGNPGEAGFGVHVTAPDGSEVAALYGYLGKATNNVAEYQALLHGLRFALARGASRVEVFSDSELLVRQIEGRYRVKNAGLQPLHGEAKALLARFGLTLWGAHPFEGIYREASASPATGFASSHRLEQERLLEAAFSRN